MKHNQKTTVIGQTKTCNHCGELKPFTEYAKRPDHITKCHTICKPCNNEKYRGKYKPTSHRDNNLQRKYGMRQIDYIAMLDAQGGVCAICSGPQVARYESFHVDHCHRTGKIRQLLCFTCNGGLGLFKDNQETMLLAIAYLQRHAS